MAFFFKRAIFFATPSPDRFYHQNFTLPCVLQRYAISK
nr:transcriptional regulator [Helicobacter pylori]